MWIWSVRETVNTPVAEAVRVSIPPHGKSNLNRSQPRTVEVGASCAVS